MEDFYKSSGGMEKAAYELVQAPVTLPDTPSTWDSSYTKAFRLFAQGSEFVALWALS